MHLYLQGEYVPQKYESESGGKYLTVIHNDKCIQFEFDTVGIPYLGETNLSRGHFPEIGFMVA